MFRGSKDWGLESRWILRYCQFLAPKWEDRRTYSSRKLPWTSVPESSVLGANFPCRRLRHLDLGDQEATYLPLKPVFKLIPRELYIERTFDIAILSRQPCPSFFFGELPVTYIAHEYLGIRAKLFHRVLVSD